MRFEFVSATLKLNLGRLAIGAAFCFVWWALVAGGINLSAIGKGSVQLVGDDGTFSLNSATPQPITDVLQVFPLGASTTG